MRHKVLILGSLGEFTELVQMAGKKGYETVVCDGYPDGPARKYADSKRMKWFDEKLDFLFEHGGHDFFTLK